ncbi:MAG: hypothetical protein K940chlam2_01590 [Chlamydiae bacterium]|nr:hypothetical protein [Chlamydiota bacterium]
MPHTLVFRSNKISLSLLHEHAILLLFALLIIGGNLLRPAFFSSNTVTEIALDGLSFTYLLRNAKSRTLWIILTLLAASTLYGIFNSGWEALSVLHGIKLFGMVCSGVAVGRVLYARYGNEVKRCVHFVMKCYLLCFALGALLLIFFPISMDLYRFLAKWSLPYVGDPHVGRLISPYLDPNYFAAIACLPLIMTPYVKRVKGWLFVICLCILLSWSRSGIATAMLIMIPLSFYLPKQARRALFIVAVLASLPLFFSHYGHTFIDRLLNFQKDPSALARVESYQWGFSYLKEHPFFGVGYNFVNSAAFKEAHLYSLDSSLLLALNCFGCVPTLAALSCCALWIHNHFIALRRQKNQNLTSFSFCLLFYIGVIFLFTSLFNNILFYQYWLIPTLALVVYCNACAKNSSYP